jgi:hypothetical protein
LEDSVNYWALGFVLLTIVGSGVLAAFALKYPTDDLKRTITLAALLMQIGFSGLAAILIPSGIVSIIVQTLFGVNFLGLLVIEIRAEIADRRRSRLGIHGQ